MHRTDLIYTCEKSEKSYKFIVDNAKKGDDSCRIALKCQECVFCIRASLNYTHYRNTVFDMCPSNCILVPNSTSKLLKELRERKAYATH